ncbi:putative lipoprotein with Yx(FWY)xxD motif [Lentzea atacamensis]|uniref:Lipoprotein with Yx(FWY)xxD motif n=1 Tax=Lentzea atacamensis TaxID=531938 RepID=A0A316IDT8_9PSEU|nr:putative lipoprotein with Yx(FWY)xxD motif [Lentzea atacamensis]RAS66843.1 putative lipoprotein with Yx(FWY)xxD motif [Lentzea atacamensis]
MLTLLLAACSAEPEETATLEQLEAAAGPVAGPTPVLPGDIAKLQVEQSPAVGPVVADREHYTLYLNTQDSTDPPKPTCLEPECTLVWPPLLAKGGQFDAPALDKALLGTVKRPDGTEQVTLGGHPVHRYVDDEQAGDAKGHGIDGRWFAIAPNGTKAAR